MKTGFGDTLDGLKDVIDFTNDPFGKLYEMLHDSAESMSKDVLPFLTKVTLPDLTAGWFLDAYALAFGAAILVAIVLLIPMFLRTARGAMAGRDLAQSVFLIFPLFLIGAMFGPAIGLLVVGLFHALSDAMLSWGILGSADGIADGMKKTLDAGNPATVMGGMFMAIVLMLLFIIGLFLVLIVLLVQLVTLYLSGVVIPLGIVWYLDPKYQRFGMALPKVWIAVLAAHPLVLFLFGVTIQWSTSAVYTFEASPGLEQWVQSIVPTLALIGAAIAPMMLLKFAPVIPTAGAAAAGAVSGAGAVIGATNLVQWLGRQQGGGSGTGGGGGPTTVVNDGDESSTSVTQSSSSSDATGGTAGAGASSGGDDASSIGAASASGAAGASGSDGAGGSSSGGTAGGGEGGSGRHAAAGTQTDSIPVIGSANPSDAAAVGSAGATGAATSSEAIAATGAAETASGAGAVIGIPTLLAAAAAKGAQATLGAAEGTLSTAAAGIEEEATE